MQNYLDEICLLLLCSVFSIMYVNSAYAVAGLLMSVIVVGMQSFEKRFLRVASMAVYVALSCFWSALLSFLALIVYAAMHDRSWIVRVMWVVPYAMQAVVAGGFSYPLLFIGALCAVGCVLGIKDVRHVSEYRGLQRAYDALKEQTIALSSKSEQVAGNEEASALAADSSVSSFFEGLTERELAVVNLVAEGLDNREISQKLFLSEGTVRNHISSILSKKDLQNRTQIAVMYYRG